MKRQLTFKFCDSEDEAKAFEKTLPRHLRGAVTPWTSNTAYEAGLNDYNHPEKWIAWYKH